MPRVFNILSQLLVLSLSVWVIVTLGVEEHDDVDRVVLAVDQPGEAFSAGGI